VALAFVGLGAQLHPAHIPEAHQAAVFTVRRDQIG